MISSYAQLLRSARLIWTPVEENKDHIFSIFFSAKSTVCPGGCGLRKSCSRSSPAEQY